MQYAKKKKGQGEKGKELPYIVYCSPQQSNSHAKVQQPKMPEKKNKPLQGNRVQISTTAHFKPSTITNSCLNPCLEILSNSEMSMNKWEKERKKKERDKEIASHNGHSTLQ